MWRLTKEKIEAWLNVTEDEFALQETKNLRINPAKWKDKHLYLDLHDIFFVEFPSILPEWVKKQTKTHQMRLLLDPLVWN